MFFQFQQYPGGRLPSPPVEKILGYLNFSDGRPDPKWQSLVNEGFASIPGVSRPWELLLDQWSLELDRLIADGSAVFRDGSQAARALMVARQAIPGYQAYHAELLGHCAESELFNSFFLVRVLESALRLIHSGGRREGAESAGTLATQVVRDLNDFVGYRPVALLETRDTGEAYDHEKHRPVPVYVRGAGAAHGPAREAVERAIAFLEKTSPRLLREAGIELDQLEELAVDMRSYDHGHPANLRPNQVFGEWDPARVDLKGRYSRLVVRKLIMDAMGDWERTRGRETSPDEALSESAAVLCGTILMASGVSGGGPGAHDSTKRLGDLLPGIARYRDLFYRELQERMPSGHLDRLRAEEKLVRQPFGKVRQFLNGWMARNRALQVQQQAMATLYARLGLPGCSRREAGKITVLAPRFMSDMLAGMKLIRFEGEQGRIDAAVQRLPGIVQRLRLGIGCGALTDPWNVLGFQGMFPLSPAREDAARDTRLDDLLAIVERLFESMTLLWAESAAAGDEERVGFVSDRMRELAEWWDKFATHRVADVRFVKGARHLKAGRGVADALARWHQRGAAQADMVFWQKHVKSLRTAQTHALVVEALLRRDDLTGAQGLLVHWISLADKIGLEDGHHNFYRLAFQWMSKATGLGQEAPAMGTAITASPIPPAGLPMLGAMFSLKLEMPPPNPVRSRLPGKPGREDPALGRVRRVTHFLSQLVVNAGEMLEVPSAEDFFGESREEQCESERAEGKGYLPSFLADQEPGGLADDPPPGDSPFDLEEQVERMEKRLRFQAAHGRLMQDGARWLRGQELPGTSVDQLVAWREESCHRSASLLKLAEELHGLGIPPPSTAEVDAFLQYERRRSLRESLTNEALSASLEQRMASLVLAVAVQAHGGEVRQISGDPGYFSQFVALGGAMFKGNKAEVRAALPDFANLFKAEPLLHTHLFQGGRPGNISRTRLAMQVIRALLGNLPRLGLFTDTLDLLRLSRRMEDRPGPDGPGVTEFVQYFSAGLQAIVEAVVHSSSGWNQTPVLVPILNDLVAPFEALWVEHSKSGQLSAMEGIGGEKEYRALQKFVKEHGRELFHARFMTLANLRGILHRGTSTYLETLSRENDPLKPSRLAEKIQSASELKSASRRLEIILKTIVENYEEFKDYNTTTTLSDYGENLNVLIDFLVLKSGYERRAWELRPRMLVHEVLARQGRQDEARAWQASLEERTRTMAEDQLGRLAQLEEMHGVRLSTVRDKIEDRFIKNLGLDRLCALIRPVLDQSRAFALVRNAEMEPLASAEEQACPALGMLEAGLVPFMEKPAGVGRDVPEWIRKLELELQKVTVSTLIEVSAPERFFLLPSARLGVGEVLGEIQAMNASGMSNPDSALAT